MDHQAFPKARWADHMTFEGHGHPGVTTQVTELALVEQRAEEQVAAVDVDPRHRDVSYIVVVQHGREIVEPLCA